MKRKKLALVIVLILGITYFLCVGPYIMEFSAVAFSAILLFPAEILLTGYLAVGRGRKGYRSLTVLAVSLGLIIAGITIYTLLSWHQEGTISLGIATITDPAAKPFYPYAYLRCIASAVIAVLMPVVTLCTAKIFEKSGRNIRYFGK